MATTRRRRLGAGDRAAGDRLGARRFILGGHIEELDAELIAKGERVGLDAPRLFDIAEEAEANLEALSKLA